jgi:hypothetical protein
VLAQTAARSLAERRYSEAAVHADLDRILGEAVSS